MKRALLMSALVLVGTPAMAQDFPPAPPIADPKPFKLPATERFTLPNGMHVTLVETGIVPKTVVSLVVRAGNVNEGPNTWLSDLTGALLTEGAGGRNSAALAAAAADMGGSLSVDVGTERTTISTDILSEHLGHAISLIADLAIRPDLPASEFARVKANLGRGLAQGLAQPGTLANAALAQTLYGLAHPYGKILPSSAQLNGYTLEQVKAFHANQFSAKRAHLYIAGRFDRAQAKAAITAAFGGWKEGAPPIILAAPRKPGPNIVLVDRPGAEQSTVRVSFDAMRAGSVEDVPQRVTNALLGGAFSSRITRNIREDKGYTYSPGSGVSFKPRAASWTFNADITTTQTGAALTEVFKEIRRLQDERPTDEEAKGIRTYQAGLFSIGNATPAAVVSTLATNDELGLPLDWTDRYIPEVLRVSATDIQSAARVGYPLSKLTLVVVGDLKTVEPQLKALPELSKIPFQTIKVP